MGQQAHSRQVRHDRVQLFQQGLDKCQELCREHPDDTTFVSIGHQIEYLMELEAGDIRDVSRLSEIIIGVQAAKWMDGFPESDREIFYQISAEAGKMSREKHGQ